MAWNDSSEFIVAGSGECYVAPVGTTEPTTAEVSLNAALVGLGYHTEDGVSINQAPDVFEARSWQSRYVTRRERQAENFRLTFVLQQWNETNVPLAFGGGDITPVSGGYKFTPPTVTDSMDYRMLVCDVVDGDRIGRFVIPRGCVVEGVDSQFARSQEALLPITFEANPLSDSVDPWYFLTNDEAAFAAGS